MKTLKSLSMVVALAAAAACALAACTALPTANQVDQIKMACNADAAARPIIDGLLDIPGLATAAEREAVAGARLVIDPVCANPASAPATNLTTSFTEASTKIVVLVAQLQARKARGPQPAASAP